MTGIEYDPRSKYYGKSPKEIEAAKAEEARHAARRGAALNKGLVHLPGQGAADEAFRARAAAEQNAVDAQRPVKNQLGPFEPPRPGSPLWAQTEMTRGDSSSTPAAITAKWHSAYNASMDQGARESLGRSWGRIGPISEEEAAAVPGVRTAIGNRWADPTIQTRAVAAADAAVPSVKAVRSQVKATGVAPGNSAYSNWPFADWSTPRLRPVG